MKINDVNRTGAVNPYRKTEEVSAVNKANGSNRKDKVEISNQAKELLEAQAANNTDRVQELKTSVQSGTYHVDAGRIAEKLLPFIKGLGE